MIVFFTNRLLLCVSNYKFLEMDCSLILVLNKSKSIKKQGNKHTKLWI